MGKFTRSILVLFCFVAAASPAAADDLFTVLELAMSNDPSLRQAEAQYRSRQMQVDQARASLLPNVSVNGSTTRQAVGLAGDLSWRPSQNAHRYSINLNQSLLNVAAWYTYQGAKAQDKAGALTFASQEQDLIIRVATAYFNILRAMENLETSRQEEAAAQRQLERTRQREEVGLIAITEVYESQAAYDLSRNNTILAEDALASSYEALEAITGQSHPNVFVLAEEFPIVPADGDVESWTQEAMNNNLALQAARYNVEAQLSMVKARRADHLPTINIQGVFNHSVTGSTQGADGSLRFSGAIDSSALSLSINIPLFTGGATSARREAAEYDLIAQRENVNLIRRQVTQQIRNAYRSVNTDAMVVAQRQQAITSAQSALDAIEAGYEVGTRNIVDVLQARQQLFVALRNYQDAKYNYVIDTLALKQTAGILTPQDIIDLNEWLRQEEVNAQP